MVWENASDALPFVEKLLQAGLQVGITRSHDSKRIFLKIAASWMRMDEEADRLEVLYRRNSITLGEGDERGKDPNYPVKKLSNVFDPYSHEISDLFVAGGEHKIFSSRCLELIVHIVQSHGPRGAGIDIAKSIKKGVIKSAYALHDNNSARTISWLIEHWAKKFLSAAPYIYIRDYYGESIAFYFSFLGFYTYWIAAPGIFGLCLFIAQLVTGRKDLIFVPFYAAFLALWASSLLEFWKRRSNGLAHMWGVTNFAETEHVRPEYKGTMQMRDIVTGQLMDWFPKGRRYVRMSISFQLLFFMVAVTLVSMISLIIFRLVINKVTMGYGAGVLNAIIMLLLDNVYRKLAIKLNDWENHRTNTQHEKSLIIKIFAFQFVNSFCSLFWYAFVDKNSDSLELVGQQLGILLIVRTVVGNAQELLVPWVMKHVRKGRVQANVSAVEQQSSLDSYDPLKEIDDWSEIVIQFGYVTFFAVAFPAAAAIALVNNLIEMRTDAYKLCSEYQRPLPRRAAGIGVWLDILQFMSYVAVLSNTALVIFSSNVMYQLGISSTSSQILVVILVEHLVFGLKFLIQLLVDDIPRWVKEEKRLESAWRRHQCDNKPFPESKAFSGIAYPAANCLLSPGSLPTDGDEGC